MKPTPDPRSSSSAAVVVICAVAVLLIGGMLVVGFGGYVFLARRNAMAEAEAMRAMEAAEMAARQAEVVAIEREKAQAMQAQMQASRTPTITIVLSVNADGGVTFGDRIVETDILADVLSEAISEADRTALIIRADPDCRFDDVIRVQEACSDLQVAEIRFEVSD